MIKVIKYFTSVEYTSGEETILDSARGPCEGPLGEDDLQTFDFISKLKLDLLEAQYTGVTRVRGSNRMQTAYRLEKDADVTLPTKYVRFTIDLFSNKSLKIFTKTGHTYILHLSVFYTVCQDYTSKRIARGIQRSLHVQSQKTAKVCLAHYQNRRHGKRAPVFNRNEPKNSDFGFVHEEPDKKTANRVVHRRSCK